MRELRNRDIGSLLILLAIAEEGSINKAAKTLYVSQPALTRTVQEFESAVGGQVFDRGAKGVTLTPFGEALMEHARTIRAEAQNAIRQATRVQEDGRRHVFLGASPYHPLRHFSRAIDRLMQEHPQLSISLRYAPPEELAQLLKHGDIEMALGPLLSGDDAHGFSQEVLFHDEMSLFCRTDHPILREATIRPARLRELKWVLGPRGSMVRTRVEGLFWTEGVEPPAITLEIEDVATRRALVVNTDYVSAFQAAQVEGEIALGRVARIDFAWPYSRRAIGAIRITPHTRISRSIVDTIRQCYIEGGVVGESDDDMREQTVGD